MYDGASATAEAALMALRLMPKRPRVSSPARCIRTTARPCAPTSKGPATRAVEAPFGADGRLDRAGWRRRRPAHLRGHRRVSRTSSASSRTCAPCTRSRAAGRVARHGHRRAAVAGAAAVARRLRRRDRGRRGAELRHPLSYGGPASALRDAAEHVRSMPGRLVGEATTTPAGAATC
jgi:hypothetical protein